MQLISKEMSSICPTFNCNFRRRKKMHCPSAVHGAYFDQHAHLHLSNVFCASVPAMIPYVYTDPWPWTLLARKWRWQLHTYNMKICPRAYVPDLPSHLCSTLTWTVIVRSHYLGIFPGYAWISPGYEVPLQLHRLLVNADQLRTTPWIWKNLKCSFAHWSGLVVYFLKGPIMHNKARVKISSFKDWKEPKELTPHIEGMDSKEVSEVEAKISPFSCWGNPPILPPRVG